MPLLRALIGQVFVIAYAGALAVGLSACSVHPLTEDVSRASTVDIVKSIRCEALAGLERLGPEELARAAPIIKATMIGYDFSFQMTEENGANGVGPKPPNSFLTFKKEEKLKLDVTGSAALRRDNLRTFIIIEPLADLTKDENRARCSDRTTRANWIYPITGRIGMDEVVRTYLKLEMLTELQEWKNHFERNKFTDVVFADDLTFTTHFSFGTQTTLVLDAVVGRLKLTNASLATNASRHDVHSVIVALTRKKIDVDERKFNGIDPKLDRQVMLLSDNVRDPRTQARLIEIDENARTRVAMELHRRRSLNDVDNVPAQVLGQRFLDVMKVP